MSSQPEVPSIPWSQRSPGAHLSAYPDSEADLLNRHSYLDYIDSRHRFSRCSPPTANLEPDTYESPANHDHGYSNPRTQGVLSHHTSTSTAEPSEITTSPELKSHITATLWEDEGCLCFHVNVGGIVVSRRGDNNFINATKILQLAGLSERHIKEVVKSERIRHVVKVAVDLSVYGGTWLAFNNALFLADRYGVTAQMYPLFVHDLETLLFNQTLAANNNDNNHNSDDTQQGVSSQGAVYAEYPNTNDGRHTQPQHPNPTQETAEQPQQLPHPESADSKIDEWVIVDIDDETARAAVNGGPER